MKIPETRAILLKVEPQQVDTKTVAIQTATGKVIEVENQYAHMVFYAYANGLASEGKRPWPPIGTVVAYGYSGVLWQGVGGLYIMEVV